MKYIYNSTQESWKNKLLYWLCMLFLTIPMKKRPQLLKKLNLKEASAIIFGQEKQNTMQKQKIYQIVIGKEMREGILGEKFYQFLDCIQGQIQDLKENFDLNKIKELINALELAETIFVMGAGRSGFIAKAFAMRLMHLGYRVYVVGETVTPRISKNDLLISISGSGETTSVVNISKKAKDLIGSKLIAITGNDKSTLARMSDIVIVLKAKDKMIKDEKLSDLAPLGTMFELTAMIFLDGLVAELMYLKKLTEKDLEARHAVLE